jgi:CRISPR type III-B/RAMP module-associated protein Cmr3
MTYLLSFKPLNRFFFGGPEAFGEKNHFVRSEYFPQNTQLFGAISRFILESTGLLKARRNGLYVRQRKEDGNTNGDVKRAIRLIGHREDQLQGNFGAISRLSPMFILAGGDRPDDALFPIPLDVKQIEKEVEEKEEKETLYSRYQLENVAGELLPVDYNVKKTTPPLLGGGDFWREYCANETRFDSPLYAYDKIFKAHSQVGIELENKEVVEERFYTKTDFSLDPSYRFGALIEIDETKEGASELMRLFESDEQRLMQIGAESVLFEMRSQSLESLEALHDHPVIDALCHPQQLRGERLVAIGEARLTDTHAPQIAYAFCPWFKNEKRLQRATKESRYRYRGKTDTGRLAPRGSVFYLKKGNQNLLPTSDFWASKLGYNTFISITSKES